MSEKNDRPQMNFDMKTKEDDGINAPSMDFTGTAGEADRRPLDMPEAPEAPQPQVTEPAPSGKGKKGKKEKPKRTLGQ